MAPPHSGLAGKNKGEKSEDSEDVFLTFLLINKGKYYYTITQKFAERI
jgi:hypothetical protein